MAQMTFLQLCTRVHQECGLSGSGPSAVTSQTGMAGKVVNWVLTAHEEIQEKHPNWRFDWAQLSVALAAQESFNPTSDWSVNVRQWDQRDEGAYVYNTSAGVNGRTFLTWLPWELWRTLPKGQSAGYPLFVTEAPDKSVKLYPQPTTGYTAVFDYWKKPETLAANGDIPRMPAQYHMAIVWRAVMLYCGHDENTPLFQAAKMNFDRVMSRMEDTELEQITFEGPLA